MDRTVMLPAFGGLVLAGAAAGMYLGQSAVDQINPFYFQGAAVHPRDRGAAIDEALVPPQGQRFADLYGWDQGNAARAADCVNCAALGARDSYAAGPQFAVIEPAWRVEPQPVRYALEPEPEAASAEQAAPPVEPSQVERYAAFPIEEKAPPEAAAAEPEAEGEAQE